MRQAVEGLSRRSGGGRRAAAALLAALAAAALTIRPAAAEEAAGRRIFLRECARCHGTSGRGDGPDAGGTDVRPADLRRPDVVERPEDELTERILGAEPRLGVSTRLGARLPETDALAAFLRSMPSLDWPRIEAGRAIFLERCLECHERAGAERGDRARGPRDLAGEAFRAEISDEELARLVRHGRPGMPALAPAVGPGEARDLAAYVRVLGPGYVLYGRHCAGCHGGRGRAGGRDGARPWLVFDDAYFASLPSEELRERIWHMLRGARPVMPHFDRKLTRDEARAVARHLRATARPGP